MKKIILIGTMIFFISFVARTQIHFAGYGGMTVPTQAATSYSLNNGLAFGVQLLYEIPSVNGLSVGLGVDYIAGKGDSVKHYRFLPVTAGVNYVWQFSKACGLSTHIGVGFNYRSMQRIDAITDKGVSFAYKVGIDMLFLRHISIGFRWNGMGNVSPYESVPVAWDQYGNVTHYEQRQKESNEFSLGVFTIVAGFRF